VKSFTTLSSVLLVSLALAGCEKNADVASRQTESGGASGQTNHGGASSEIDKAAELIRSEVAPEEHPEIADADYAAFIAGANRFGLELGQQVVDTRSLDKTRNGVFSPLSALIALSMTYAAAEGDVANAMKTALHDELGAEKYHVAQNRMLRELASYNYEGAHTVDQTKRVEVALANSLWADRSAGIKTSFLDLMGRAYDTGVYRTDFQNAPEPSRLAINAWVEDKTRNKVNNLLKESDISTSTEFVLVNALYFYANWSQGFEQAATQKEAFDTLAGTPATVDMMHRTGAFEYRATEQYEVVLIPYVNNQLRLTLVLPKAGQFEAIRSGLSGDFLAEATSGVGSKEVALGLPRFAISTGQLELSDALAKLGFFDGGKELTGLGDQSVRISGVYQKAFVGTDETGTEASAATAVVMDVSISPEPIVVTFNRPFLFFVQAKSGLVLFSGQVVDPSSNTSS
jgi:serpin B